LIGISFFSLQINVLLIGISFFSLQNLREKKKRELKRTTQLS